MSEHGGHFGLLLGNWPVGSKLEGGEVCKDRLWWPRVEGKRAYTLWACWASKKALMASEQPPWSTQQVSELPQGTGALGTVPWPGQHWHPGSCSVSGVVLPVWAQIPAGEPGRDFNSCFLHCSGSLQTQGVPTRVWSLLNSCVICANSVLESKGVTQSSRCEPIKLGSSYLLKCR